MRIKHTVAVLMLGMSSLVFGAAALAQTPGPTPSATKAASTPAGQPTFVPTIVLPGVIYQAGGGPFAFASPAFERVWDRTDGPVASGEVSRTWFWGPGPNTPGLSEQYNEAPAGDKRRLVQYFDKSRMEINNPNGDPNNPFYVTNGLLTVELISGFVQVGEKDFVKYHSACIPMSGDFGDNLAPTYRAFQGVSNTQAGDHNAPNRTGQKATETIDRDGKTGNDPSKASVPGVDFAYYEPQTKHNIPKVFWDFLNSSGPVHDANHKLVNQQLITPWFFASGLPISEPYWAKAVIQGQIKDVMIQAFERRALTYVPTNTRGFQVEMANIGQHYFDWRYRNGGLCPGDVGGTPTAPVPAATGTPGVAATLTAVGTTVATNTPCPRCPSPTPTNTIHIPPATIVQATIVTDTPAPTKTPVVPPSMVPALAP
jgi:hypothetical protein